MRKLWAAGGVLTAAAVFAAPSGAATAVSSGDTCLATGHGNAYTLVVSLPSTASEQGGFAFGAAGVKINNIISTSNPGALSTQSLPVGTSLAWLVTSPPSVVPGSQLTATVKTNHAVSGSFTVVPATATTNGVPMSYYAPINCTVAVNTTPSTAFIVHGPFRYDRATGMWWSYVSVAGRGRVDIGAKGSPKPLIHNRTYAARGAGKVKITLVPTDAGKAALASSGSIKIRLAVEFAPRGGKTASKLITLTLRK